METVGLYYDIPVIFYCIQIRKFIKFYWVSCQTY